MQQVKQPVVLSRFPILGRSKSRQKPVPHDYSVGCRKDHLLYAAGQDLLRQVLDHLLEDS